MPIRPPRGRDACARRGLATNGWPLQSACTVSSLPPTTDSDLQTIAARLAAVHARIAAAAKAGGRDPAAVTLVQSARRSPPSARRRRSLRTARLRREPVQEAAAVAGAEASLAASRAPSHRPAADEQGEEAVALFDVIETVDRPKLAQVLAAEMVRGGRRRPATCRSIPARSRRRPAFCRRLPTNSFGSAVTS
jgi:hypothetical protein